MVFGKSSGWNADESLFNLSTYGGGFVIRGLALNDRAGYSVSSAGDLNGDGFDDIIVGAPTTTGSEIGQAYIVLAERALIRWL